MEFKLPYQTIIEKSIEQISVGVQLKMSQIEEQRNRDFMYQMKELEFYKSNYEKDLKDIFDYWFELIRITQIKDNTALTKEQRESYNEKWVGLMNVDTIAKYRMNTLKYGGRETARILAMVQMSDRLQKENNAVTLFIWTTILSVLKKDILGQELDSLDVLRVLVNDFEENETKILEAKKLCVKLYKDTYGKDPYWK